MGNRPATRTVLDMYKLYDRDPVITAKNEEEKERKKHLEFETKTQWRGGNNRVEDEDPVGRNSRAPLLSEHNQKLMYRHVIITARTDGLSDAELMAPTARKPTLVETSAVVVLPSCLIKGRKTKKKTVSVRLGFFSRHHSFCFICYFLPFSSLYLPPSPPISSASLRRLFAGGEHQTSRDLLDKIPIISLCLLYGSVLFLVPLPPPPVGTGLGFGLYVPNSVPFLSFDGRATRQRPKKNSKEAEGDEEENAFIYETLTRPVRLCIPPSVINLFTVSIRLTPWLTTWSHPQGRKRWISDLISSHSFFLSHRDGTRCWGPLSPTPNVLLTDEGKWAGPCAGRGLIARHTTARDRDETERIKRRQQAYLLVFPHSNDACKYKRIHY